MEDISVVELLTELLADEKKTNVLQLISDGLYGDELLERLLDSFKGE
jgi:hypothetical protein